jgi:hypothetical protein
VQGSDHLDVAVAALGDRVGSTCQDGSRRGLGIDRVGLAAAPTSGTVGPVHLDDTMALLVQVAGEVRAPTSGAFDTEPSDRSESDGPVLEPLRASQGGRDSELAESPTHLVDRHCDVDVGVSVDPDDHVGGVAGRDAVDSVVESIDLITA